MLFFRIPFSHTLKTGIVTLLFLTTGYKTLLFSQSGLCDPSTPFYSVDLTGFPNGTWTSPFGSRIANCCGTSSPNRCVEFSITLDPTAVAINFQIASGAPPQGALFYQINCGPQIPVGSPICINGPGPFTITFCKPGSNGNSYSITSIAGPTGSPDKTVGNGCNTTISISGVTTSSIAWTSIFPGSTGDYNSYLSCSTACDSTIVTAQTGHPAYVDYQVCGTPAAGPCVPPGQFCDTIRVYMSTPLLNTINPNPAAFCANNPSVLLTGVVNGGVPPYTYAWTNGANGTGAVVGTGLTYTATTIGNYSFIVYDQNYPACPAPITNVTVTSSPVPTVNAGIDQTMCGTYLALNGAITGATGGIWSGGSGTFIPGNTTLNATYTPTFAELSAGTVILTLTSTGNGACNPVSDQVVLYLSTPIIATITSPPVICFGQTATISANASGGIAPYTYLWNTGATTQSVANVLPGTYNVTVTGGGPGFCSTTASVTLSANPQIIVTTSPNNAIVCSATATISASATGGTGTLNYLWSNGATTSSTNVNTGTYTITVTDSVGCSAHNSVSVTASSSLAATINQPSVLCFGAVTNLTATVSGGLGGNSFLWTNSATTAGIIVGAGNYCATVTDAGGCITTACVTLIENPALIVSIPPPPVICNSASATIYATVSGGQAPYTFMWNTGATTQSLIAPAGTYTVTVTDFTGCVNSASVTISQAALINIATSSVGVGCFGGNNGSASAIVSGGIPSYFYSWLPYGGSSATASGLVAGSYTLTVTDTIGCSLPATVVVSEPLALTATISVQNHVSCFGGNNGAAIVTPAGGTPVYSYLWNPQGGTVQNPVNLIAGAYTVTVSDLKGCIISIQTTITEPPLLTASIVSTTDVSCNGGNTGSATILAAGGSPGYTYSWAPAGGTNATASNLTVGSYTVTITDIQSCTVTLTIIINQPPVLTSIISNSTNLICAGDSNGSATVAPSGGTSPYTYAWNTNPVQTTATATNLGAGSYSVTVTDSKNCTTISPAVTITGPPPVTVAASASSFVSCDTIITIFASSVSGGSGGYTYLWNTGETSSSINVSTGEYIITVSDAMGCSGSDTVSVLASNSTLASTITPPANICFGTTTAITVNVTGGVGSESYLWNTSATTSSITAGAGSYCVTVTDGAGCITTSCVTVIQNPQINVTIATPPDICPGGSTTVTAVGSGGQLPYSYLWNSGETSQSVLKPAGTYTVTISDITGSTCSANTSITITEVPPINTTMSFTDVSCFGANNGSALVYATGGAPGYTYFWAPSGGTNSSATLLASGTYTVTVTDTIGCTQTGNVTITQPASPVTITLTATDNLCFADSAGTATASGNGGTAPYFYYWPATADTLSTITGLIAGTYSVFMADSIGCSITSSVVVSAPPEIIITSSAAQISCFGETGSVGLLASGGTGTLVITGSDTLTLAAGTYNYTVTDANACSKTSQAIIYPAPPQLILTATPTQITCFGGTGSVTLAASGGTGMLIISGDATTNLAPGIYNYTVTDSNGCTANASATINMVAAVTLTATASQIACFGGTGSVSLLPSGGTGAFVITGDDTTNLVAGTYNYMVTDANSCTANAFATINYGPSSAVSLSATTTQIICGGTGSVSLTASGGTGTFTISGDDTLNLAAGTYNYTAMDANGCTASVQAIISASAPALILTATATQISCFGGTGSVALVASGGTGPLVISGDSTANLPADTYNYTVSDSIGCASTAQAVINTAPAILTVSLTATPITCFGLSDGTATAIGNGGTSPFYYAWQNGDTTATSSNLSIGTYSVTITDDNGCIATSSSVNITEPTEITLSGTTVASTCGLNNGSATVMAAGGTGAYTYLWSPSGGTNSLADSLLADDYTVSVTDSNACQQQMPLTVSSASFLIADFNATDVCLNNPTLFTDSSITSPGSTITSWQWDFGNSSPPDTTQNPDYIYPNAGNYNVSLTVNSSDGCVSTVTHAVNVHFMPTANFSGSKACLGASTLFSDLSGISGGDIINSWLWDFGDSSSPATIQNPAHTYTLPGTFTTTLSVSSNYGCIDTVSYPTIVYAPPVAQFIVDDSSGCIVHCPQFTDTSDPLNGTITSWQWNFGDGTALGTQITEEHCFTTSGVFTVSLTVTTSNGCISTISLANLINVYQAPVAEFDYSPQPPTSLSSEIHFNNLSVDASSWLWDFGDINDINGSALEFPTHNYAEVGNYCITLIVQNNYQCTDTVIHCLDIEPEFTFFIPNAFTPSESPGTNDGFTGYGTNIIEYEMWIFDRWGNMIFYTADLRIPWDGRANKGKDIAQRDVYVYLVELKDFKGNHHQYRGIVTLVR